MDKKVTTWLANELGDKYWEAARFADTLGSYVDTRLGAEFAYPESLREAALQEDGYTMFQDAEYLLKMTEANFYLSPALALIAGDALADSPWEHAGVFGRWWDGAKNVAKHLVTEPASVYEDILESMVSDMRDIYDEQFLLELEDVIEMR